MSRSLCDLSNFRLEEKVLDLESEKQILQHQGLMTSAKQVSSPLTLSKVKSVTVQHCVLNLLLLILMCCWIYY